MKWVIPAKTFLLGEYAALAGAPAMLLTTSPCFELSLTAVAGLHGIHPDSPAGRWWKENNPSDTGLQWHDPYQGCGGLGASSAQFLGAYLASRYLQKKEVRQQDLLEAYLRCAWSGEGVCPSGYDVLAQLLHGCVYIDKQKSLFQSYSWPFCNIAFLLLHTGQKLATHQHLQAMGFPSQMNQLTEIVEQAKCAFERTDHHLLIDAVNAYHQNLEHLGLVAEHSMKHVAFFRGHSDVLAAKGCGAMGADVLLLLVPQKRLRALNCYVLAQGWKILATSKHLYI